VKQIILKLVVVTIWAIALLGVGFAVGERTGHSVGYEDGFDNGQRAASTRALAAMEDLERQVTEAVSKAVLESKRKLVND